MKVYGLKVSYFTGKLEGYLRYKGIAYDYCPMTIADFQGVVRRETGAMQMPAVQLDDGRWMTDTSPMIDWFETQHPDAPILPADPVQAYVCRLIEDYADEWLWRPAMHFRWSYPAGAKLLARQISDEMGEGSPVPRWILRNRIEHRQRYNFVRRDGITQDTRSHAEQGYFRLLDILSTVFETRPFLFGDRPTLADIGLFGPLFRHFAMDPTPGAIMRETRPAVMEWVYRLWNAKGARIGGNSLVSGIPDDLLPLLKEIGGTHLEALCANATAWKGGQKRHDMTVQGVTYRDIQTSQYRVWCLEKLQQRHAALGDNARKAVTDLLDSQACLEPLQRIALPSSGYDPQGQAPFGRSIPVFAHVQG